MGDSIEGDELAELRARAYGRAAQGLSTAEQARMDELERMRRGAGAGPAGSPAAGGPVNRSVAAPTSASVARDAQPRPFGGDAPAPVAGDDDAALAPAPAPPEVVRLRPSRTYLVALVVAATFVPVAAIGGFMAGAWFADLGGAATAEPTMLGGQDDAEVDASLERVRGGQAWDDAAPALLGGTADGLVWWGTVAEGAQTCIVLDLTDIGPMPLCGPTEVVRTSGLGGELTVMTHSEGVDVGGAPTTTPLPPTTITYAVNPYAGSFAVTTRAGQ